jgi:hypothetical protein
MDNKIRNHTESSKGKISTRANQLNKVDLLVGDFSKFRSKLEQEFEKISLDKENI